MHCQASALQCDMSVGGFHDKKKGIMDLMQDLMNEVPI